MDPPSSISLSRPSKGTSSLPSSWPAITEDSSLNIVDEGVRSGSGRSSSSSQLFRVEEIHLPPLPIPLLFPWPLLLSALLEDLRWPSTKWSTLNTSELSPNYFDVLLPLFDTFEPEAVGVADKLAVELYGTLKAGEYDELAVEDAVVPLSPFPLPF